MERYQIGPALRQQGRGTGGNVRRRSDQSNSFVRSRAAGEFSWRVNGNAVLGRAFFWNGCCRSEIVSGCSALKPSAVLLGCEFPGRRPVGAGQRHRHFVEVVKRLILTWNKFSFVGDT